MATEMQKGGGSTWRDPERPQISIPEKEGVEVAELQQELETVKALREKLQREKEEAAADMHAFRRRREELEEQRAEQHERRERGEELDKKAYELDRVASELRFSLGAVE